MAQRKRTPDILGNLLGDRSPDNSALAVSETPVGQQNDEVAKSQAVLTLRQLAVKTPKHKNGKTTDPNEAEPEPIETEQSTKGKVKITFYLDEASVEQLEDAQLLLRKIARKSGITGKAATSKSALLEHALKIACLELEAHGEQSPLAQNLLSS